MVKNNPEQEDGKPREGKPPSDKHHDDSEISIALRALLQEYKAQSDNQEGREQENIAWTRRGFWGQIGYTFISAFTLAAAVYGNHINSETLVSTQRAYITPDGLNFSIVAEKKGKYPFWYVGLTLENSGNTATRDMFYGVLPFTWYTQIFTKKQVDAGLSKQLIPVPGPLYQRAALGPREKLPVGRFEIGYDEIEGLKRGTSRVYLYGTIFYRDIFEKPPGTSRNFAIVLLRSQQHPLIALIPPM